LPLELVKSAVPFRKNHSVNDVAANPDGGDAYWFSFKTGSVETGESIKAWISKKVQNESALDEIITRMRTREKVSLSEVASILAEHGLPSSKEDSRKVVEYGITKKGVEGVIDDEQFLSKYALGREQVRYDIITTFEVGKNGAVVLKCPNCGASIPLQSKEESNVCKYCGAPYTVPRNILKLL